MSMSSGRAAFEATLLDAACFFANTAATYPVQHTSQDPELRSERQSLVIGCVLTSVAFLEATLNGVWDDLGNLKGEPESWFKGRRNLARISTLGVPDSLNLPLLSRFDLTLAITDSPALDPGSGPYQDVHLLIMLRNALSHSKPEWEQPEDELPSPRTLERRLRGRFRQDGAWKGTHPPFIPHRCLSSDCARWALESVTDFALEFFDHLSVMTITIGVVRLVIQRWKAGAGRVRPISKRGARVYRSDRRRDS